jgi:hypothetical protein
VKQNRQSPESVSSRPPEMTGQIDSTEQALITGTKPVQPFEIPSQAITIEEKPSNRRYVQKC